MTAVKICILLTKNLYSSLLSDITCGDDTGLGDLSSLYEMFGEMPKMATPLQPASVRKRRSLGRCLYDLFLPYLLRLGGSSSEAQPSVPGHQISWVSD